MNPDDVMGEVKVQPPLYEHVPCEQSTGPLAQYVADRLGTVRLGNVLPPTKAVELYILRWLCDNRMIIVKRN